MNNDISNEKLLDILCEIIRYVNSISKIEKSSFSYLQNSRKISSANNRINKRISEFKDLLNIELLYYDGSDYSAELPVEALNLEDFAENDKLIVQDTLEPTVKEKDSSHILKYGKVLVSKKLM